MKLEYTTVETVEAAIEQWEFHVVSNPWRVYKQGKEVTMEKEEPKKEETEEDEPEEKEPEEKPAE